MANVFINEHTASTIRQGSPLPLKVPPLAAQTVAIGGSSAQSAAFNAKTQVVVVHAGAICSIEFGSNPTATATSMRMNAGETRKFEVTPGHRVAVITNT